MTGNFVTKFFHSFKVNISPATPLSPKNKSCMKSCPLYAEIDGFRPKGTCPFCCILILFSTFFCIWGHSTITWTKFYPISTPYPLARTFVIPPSLSIWIKGGKKPPSLKKIKMNLILISNTWVNLLALNQDLNPFPSFCPRSC